METNRPILLVEDDRVDVMTVERALADLKVSNPLEIAGNGIEALEKLRGGLKPCLILLDVNMPRMNGIEFLGELREDETLAHLVVVVMTTSREERDRIESFRLGVAGYMVKPTDYLAFVEVMRAVNAYWSLSLLPPEVS